jgi:hypothetical protein
VRSSPATSVGVFVSPAALHGRAYKQQYNNRENNDDDKEVESLRKGAVILRRDGGFVQLIL